MANNTNGLDVGIAVAAAAALLSSNLHAGSSRPLSARSTRATGRWQQIWYSYAPSNADIVSRCLGVFRAVNNGGDDIPVYALFAYAKSARTDLNPAERRAVAGIVVAIKGARKEKP